MTDQMVFDPYLYKIEIVRETSEDRDLCFKASVAELPDFSLHESTVELAYQCTIEALQDLYESAVDYGHPFPSPRTKVEDDWTGRVTLRLPKNLHRRLAQQSEVEGVSLNTWLVSRLSDDVGVYEAVATVTAAISATSRFAVESRSVSLKPFNLGASIPQFVNSSNASVCLASHVQLDLHRLKGRLETDLIAPYLEYPSFSSSTSNNFSEIFMSNQGLEHA